MARDIYARTASRGFPVFDNTGSYTGVGHLQDVTRLPDRAGVAVPGQQYPHNDPANVPAQLAAPQEYILGLSLWGLPAMPSMDNTPHGVEYDQVMPGDIGPGGVSAVLSDPHLDPYPKGAYHDAPLIDPSLATFDPLVGKESLRAEAFLQADATRQPQQDTSEEILNPGQPINARIRSHAIGFQGVIEQDHVGPVEGNDPDKRQEKVTGSLRGNAGFDSIQGYGGGGKGPGGTNLPQLTEDHRDYPGTFYSHDAFTSAAEVPHLDAEAAQFIQNQPGQAAWTGAMWSHPLTTTHAQDVIAADVPLQGQPVPVNTGVLLTPMWG
jgi:hypothetical protein